MNEKEEIENENGKGYRFNRNGWIYLHVEGNAKERGYQHGALLAQEIKIILRSLKYLTYFNTGKEWRFFVDAAEDLFPDHMDREVLLEIEGIAEGASSKGVDVTWQEILAWNGYSELTDYWWPTVKEKLKYTPFSDTRREHCSAFIANEPATGGKIVMAHNTWDNFETGQFSNVIIDLVPTNGHRILMQCSPGFIDSFTDFFVTEAGIMGTETTMGGFNLYKPDESPEFNRVRMAMQYADDLDDFIARMQKQNNGGYANSWLLGSIETNEIVRFELGLEFSHEEWNPDCGYFIGFNAPLDPRIRNLECLNTGFADIRRHQGGRQVRLAELMDYYIEKGELNVQAGKEILADHCDVYKSQKNGYDICHSETCNNPCSRTVCGHYELDPREYMSQPGRPLPFQPRGTVDGKVCDSDMAKELSFWARWGNSCGMPFMAGDFIKKHRQWDYLKDYLYDRPSQVWTEFGKNMRN